MLDATNPLDYSQGLPPALAVTGRSSEAMAMVFIINAFATGNWNTAFKLLKK